MRTFFDYDHVECVEVAIAMEKYPSLYWTKIKKRFVWGMGINEDVDVMTLADLNLCIRLRAEKIDIDDINYSDVAHCSVCRKVLLPDDEAYTDEKTGDSLCSAHAVFNEATNNYVKHIF